MTVRLQDAKIQVSLETDELQKEISQIEERVKKLNDVKSNVISESEKAKRVIRNVQERVIGETRKEERKIEEQEKARSRFVPLPVTGGIARVGAAAAVVALPIAINQKFGAYIQGVLKAAKSEGDNEASKALNDAVSALSQGLRDVIAWIDKKVESVSESTNKTLEVLKAQLISDQGKGISLANTVSTFEDYRAVSEAQYTLERARIEKTKKLIGEGAGGRIFDFLGKAIANSVTK